MVIFCHIKFILFNTKIYSTVIWFGLQFHLHFNYRPRGPCCPKKLYKKGSFVLKIHASHPLKNPPSIKNAWKRTIFILIFRISKKMASWVILYKYFWINLILQIEISLHLKLFLNSRLHIYKFLVIKFYIMTDGMQHCDRGINRIINLKKNIPKLEGLRGLCRLKTCHIFSKFFFKIISFQQEILKFFKR